MAYVDDKNAVLYLPDVKVFLEEFQKQASPLGMHLNISKTRILTSTNGCSAIPAISHRYGPDLAAEIEDVIARFSNKPCPSDTSPHATTPVEVTTGLPVLGQPVGSEQFASDFFDEAASKVEDQVSSLFSSITDKAKLMRLFSSCAMHKTPHLLGLEALYFFDEVNPESWDTWNGPLALQIDADPSMLIAYIAVVHGGLGFMDPFTRAIPDFIVTMTGAIRAAQHGFYMGKDAPPLCLPQSIARHFTVQHNPSPILVHFGHFLPHIATIAAPKAQSHYKPCGTLPSVYKSQNCTRSSPPCCQRQPARSSTCRSPA